MQNPNKPRGERDRGGSRQRPNAKVSAEPEKKEKKRLSKALSVIAIIALAIGGGMLGGKYVSEGEAVEGEAEETNSMIAKVQSYFEKEPIPMLIEMEPFTTNLSSKEKRQQIVKVSVSIEVMGEEHLALAESKQPILRDALLKTISSETISSIYEREESGDWVIKGHMKKILNESLDEPIITDVFITDLITSS